MNMKLLLPCPNVVVRGITDYFENLVKSKSLLPKIHKECHFVCDFKPFMGLKLRTPALADGSPEPSLKRR